MLRDSLLKLFHSAMSELSLDSSISIAGDLIEQGVEMPDPLESLLIDFLTNKNSDSFVVLAREVLAQNLLDDYIESIKLISFMTRKEWLPLRDVALMLSAIPYSERTNLLPTYQKAVEVADLVCEDLSDGIMEADDDDLLLNALNNI